MNYSYCTTYFCQVCYVTFDRSKRNVQFQPQCFSVPGLNLKLELKLKVELCMVERRHSLLVSNN